MPNWCSVTYKVVGQKKQVKKLYDVLNKMNERKHPVVQNGFGTMWLGEIVNEMKGNWEEIRCRGYVTDYGMFDESDDVLTIYYESAWCEMDEFRRFIESKLKGIKIYYYAEECGCEYYVSNDVDKKFFDWKYVVDNDRDGIEYYDDLENVAELLSELTNKEVPNDLKEIKKAVEEYEEGKDDAYFSINEIVYEND